MVMVNNDKAITLARLARDEFFKGNSAQAEIHVRESLELDSQFVPAYDLLSSLLEQAGRFDESAEIARRGLEVEPTTGSLYYHLVRGRRVDDPGLASEIETVLSSGGVALPDARYLHYALGKAYDDLNEYESAMNHWDRANAISHKLHFPGKPFDRAGYQAYFDRTRSLYTAEFLRGNLSLGSESDLPIFIVGMPRSGTTLVEQILSNHPDVGAGGEIQYWVASDASYTRIEAHRGVIAGRHAVILQTGYLKALARVSPGTARVTDKMPDNYMVMGRILALFPKARFVHIRRNPADNCLSIYATPYSRPPSYVYAKDSIAIAYETYLGLMEHWWGVLPAGSILDVDYEDLVSDTEPSVRRMLEFCGLSWCDACLAPESNSRTVRTPSAWQVRQPIYDRSVGKWKHYQAWLGPIATLAGPSPRSG